MSRPRNNITRLSSDVRLRICAMLDDGATYDAIRQDAEVAAECAERQLKLHSTTFAAYKAGEEFDEFRTRNRAWSEELTRNNIAARIVESAGGSDNIARLANYEIMKICIAKLRDGEALDPQELRSISAAVSSYEKTRIAAEKEDSKREYAEKEAKYQAQIAELSAKIAGLTGQKETGGLSAEAIEKIENAANLL